MSFSAETQEKINQFAEEQALYYLDNAEMTYQEKLRTKASRTRQKAGRKLLRFIRYYEDYDPAEYEIIGLFYGGFILLGLVFGALFAYLVSGSRHEFLNGGWVDVVVGAVVGFLAGVGLGQLSQAVISIMKKR